MRQAFQHVRRLFQNTPVFAITIVALLAVGIGASAAIFALVNAVLIRPLPYADADQLVAVHHFGSKVGSKSQSRIRSDGYLPKEQLHASR
jgi:hypothetical protein